MSAPVFPNELIKINKIDIYNMPEPVDKKLYNKVKDIIY